MSRTKKNMENATPSVARTVVTARTDVGLKETFEREAPLRGHTVSQALELALKLGLARYLKRYPKQFERVGKAA